MSKHTVGDTEVAMSDSGHSSLVNRVSSAGTEPVDWIGPNIHTHRPSADAAKAAGDQPAGYLGPTSQLSFYIWAVRSCRENSPLKFNEC